MLPLGELVEDPEEVDAGEHVAPAEGRGVTDLQRLRRQLGLLPDDARREVQEGDAAITVLIRYRRTTGSPIWSVQTSR